MVISSRPSILIIANTKRFGFGSLVHTLIGIMCSPINAPISASLFFDPSSIVSYRDIKALLAAAVRIILVFFADVISSGLSGFLFSSGAGTPVLPRPWYVAELDAFVLGQRSPDEFP
jgi:hypothetical protein